MAIFLSCEWCFSLRVIFNSVYSYVLITALQLQKMHLVLTLILFTVESISSTQITPSTSFFSSTSGSQLSKRAKTLLGVVGAILCLAIIAGMLFVIWQKKGFRFQGMPRFLFQPNSPEQEHDTAALSSNQQRDHLTKNQRTSLIPLIRNRNSSYRSQLSSAASSGTVLTYADGKYKTHHET